MTSAIAAPSPPDSRKKTAPSDGVVVNQASVAVVGFTLGPLTFSVRPGRPLAVVGKTGSGKSLLLRSLVGLQPLTSGEVRVGGHNLGVGQPPISVLKNVRREVGMSFQRGALLDEETALENVAIAARAASRGTGSDPRGVDLDVDQLANARAMQALKLVGLDGAHAKRPRELSGGMRRRVGLARALVNARSVLLCDDVTAGLDPSTAAEVIYEIVSIARQREAALIVTTHDVDVVLAHVEQVLVLKDGAPLFLGAAKDMADHVDAAAFAPRMASAGAPR